MYSAIRACCAAGCRALMGECCSEGEVGRGDGHGRNGVLLVNGLQQPASVPHPTLSTQYRRYSRRSRSSITISSEQLS